MRSGEKVLKVQLGIEQVLNDLELRADVIVGAVGFTHGVWLYFGFAQRAYLGRLWWGRLKTAKTAHP